MFRVIVLQLYSVQIYIYRPEGEHDVITQVRKNNLNLKYERLKTA